MMHLYTHMKSFLVFHPPAQPLTPCFLSILQELFFETSIYCYDRVYPLK